MIKYMKDYMGVFYASVRQDETGIIYTVMNQCLSNGTFKQHVVKNGRGLGSLIKSTFAFWAMKPLITLNANTQAEAEKNVRNLAELVDSAPKMYDQAMKKALEDALREHKEKND